jgi:hypothetical protein
MDAEHQRPLAAFVVVSAASALLLGQSLLAQPAPPAGDRPATSQASGQTTSSSGPSSNPASGQAVDGVTSTPTGHTVKSIGRAPTLMAPGDDGIGVSIGTVPDRSKKPTDPVRTRENLASPGPQAHPGPHEPKPSGGPPTGPDDDGSPGSSSGHSQGPRGNQGPPGTPGPRNDGMLPTPQQHGPQ